MTVFTLLPFVVICLLGAVAWLGFAPAALWCPAHYERSAVKMVTAVPSHWHSLFSAQLAGHSHRAAGLPHVKPANWVKVDWGTVQWLPFLEVMFW